MMTRKGKGKRKSTPAPKASPAEFPLAGRPQVPVGVSARRHAWQLRMEPLVTTTVTSATQSNVPVGSQFANVTLAWSLRSFYEGSDPAYRIFDMFRFKSVTVYASLPSEGAGIDFAHTVYASVDLDDLTATQWSDFASRSNSSMVVLRNAYPVATLAKFKPKANYISSTTAQADPSNAIPDSDQWFDMTALSQQFGGLKIHLNAPGGTTTSVRFYARAEFEFRGKI